MKNLLIYISKTGSFHSNQADVAGDASKLVKVQIENSLALGWKPEDILIYTNFVCTYGPITATILKDVKFFDRKPQASKINAIVKLFDMGLIKKGELYWFHDLDAFQLEPIRESEIHLKTDEIAVTKYGGIKFLGVDRLSTGTIFFKSGAGDIFRAMQEVYYKNNIDEEEALGILVKDNPKIKNRVKQINPTYNFIGYHLRSMYAEATKPLKVAHFHPGGGLRRAGVENSLRFFKGENKLGVPLITSQLIKLLRYHRLG